MTPSHHPEIEGFDYRSLAVLIPARNEQSTVGSIVREVKDTFNCEVIVIDDASTDGTLKAAKNAGATVLPLCLPLNAWGAVQAGLRYALKSGFKTFVTLDSDGQHPTDSIPALILPLIKGRADVVIGACPKRGSHARHISWAFFRMLTGLNYADLTSGLRAYCRPAVATLASSQATALDYQDLGVLLLLRKAGFIIKEVPVTMGPRLSGKSRVFNSWFAVFRYLLQSGILCLSKFTIKLTPNVNN